MIKYTDQMKHQKLNIVKKRKGRAKKLEKRCIDILTFDIEVTSAWRTPSGKMIGYKPGKSSEYWNSLEKFSLPYIWQFSFNDTVYYGREIESFKKVLDDLPDDVQFKIFVHNLSYEYAAALINLFTVKQVFARTPHAPMYAYFNEHPNVQFCCSYILTNMSLDTWGKQLGVLKKTGDLNYYKLRTPKTKLTKKELMYCEMDCRVVHAGILDHLNVQGYKDVFDIPLTSTGKVRRPFKALVQNDKDYMSKIKKLVPESVDEYERWRKIFAGGYTHCSRKYLDKVVTGPIYHVDIASSYPFILCAYKFPYSKWAYLGQVLPDTSKFDSRAYITLLRFKRIKCKTWNTYISTSKLLDGKRIIKDNGRLLYGEDVMLYVTEFDYDTIMATYQPEPDEVESLGCWVCGKQYLPKIYIDFVLTQYGNKTSLKGVDPVKYAISKTYINSMYGMAVSNIVQSDVLYDDVEGWSIAPLTRAEVEAKFERMRRWFDKSYFLHYAAGCYVTAAARHRLWQCIRSIDSDLVYTDTDSLFYLNEHSWDWFNQDATERLERMCLVRGIDFDRTRPKDKNGIAHPLGVLEFEETCDRFKSCGAKKYVEERGGSLYMTISGVSKKAVSALDGDINNFRDGFVFDKDHPNMHKSEVTYIDNMPDAVYPDGYVSHLKHGVNMRPTSYELSTPNVYNDFEKVLNALANPTEQMYIKQRGVIRE